MSYIFDPKTFIEQQMLLGKVYLLSESFKLDDGIEKFIQITPGSKQVFIYWEITADKAMETYLYDNIGTVANGTVKKLYNTNRNYSDNAETVVKVDIDYTTNNSEYILDKVIQGIDSRRIKSGASIQSSLILKPNTTYVRKFVSNDDNNNISVNVFIVEL